MKINRLELKNFRSYEDKTVFNFATDNEKNIILIGGKNGAGKSTIFEAIKICIYGPKAYKYQGFNSSYIAKVKSNINNNSLKDDTIYSYVSIDLEINENTDKNIYTITRSWTFKNKKLSEKFLVYKNHSNIALSEEELNYFENYIVSILSPKMFDFFFFDGEHLSDFFIGKNSNRHLKQSLLSLCNFDTFDILKNTIIYNKKLNTKNESDIEIAQNKYLNLNNKIKELENQKNLLLDEYDIVHCKIDNLQAEKDKAEKEFKKKGGLLLEEKQRLSSRILELETRRNIINQEIKDFCNDMLPFLMLKTQIKTLKNQIELENEGFVYSQIKDKISSNSIKNLLLGKIDDSLINKVSNIVSSSLINDIAPKNNIDDFQSIHMLSIDKSSSILNLINDINNFNGQDILNLFTEHRTISSEILDIRNKINISLEEDETQKYVDKIAELSTKIGFSEESLNNLSSEIQQVDEELQISILETEKTKNEYINLLQSNNIVDMSSKLIVMLEDIINNLTINKIKEIQHNFMYIFKKIIQKNNFIDFIDIDYDFNISLYINRIYNSLEIDNLIENIGYEEAEKKFGKLFFEDLFKEYKISTKQDLLNKIKSESMGKFIELRTKVDINEFSSGEKQIYILCLYWALLKVSNIEIPFIIDTPYARIDQMHRDNITSEYFTTISNQVVILSTNTEIDENSYIKIKPNLSKEYLIKYDDQNRKTIQSEGYFFEV